MFFVLQLKWSSSFLHVQSYSFLVAFTSALSKIFEAFNYSASIHLTGTLTPSSSLNCPVEDPPSLLH